MCTDRDKIEENALYALVRYINRCPKLKSYCNSNDKTPIWDGEIHIHRAAQRTVANFIGRVPLQIKGTTNMRDKSYRIEREYVEAYKADSGCVFFMVQEDKKDYEPVRILYAILSSSEATSLLQHNTKTIKIDLKEVPANPLDFEKELIAFAEERNGKRIENTYPKEIEALIKHFNDIKQHLDEVEDNGVKYELESYLNTILSLRNDGTVGWRDKFIYLARKVLDLTLQHIKEYDALNLQFELGNYLYDQKLYHLVEDYYLQALEQCRERAKDSTLDMSNVASVLNNLGLLHKDLNQYTSAEKEYQEALEIRRKLAKDNPDAYLADVAITLTNLATLHSDLNQFAAAENEYKEALNIQQKLAKENPEAYLADVAKMLHNLAVLHKNLNQYDGAEKEYQEALNIRRKLAKDNPEAYLSEVAMTLNNLGNVHKDLNQYAEARKEYQEALETYRKLAKGNPDAYLAYVAATLNNFAIMHYNLNQYEAAENKHLEALEIRRKLAKDYPDAYLAYVAKTLNNLAALHLKSDQHNVAELEFKESLDIYRKLAEDNPDAYLGYVAKTLNNLAVLHENFNQYDIAEEEYQEALKAYRKLAKDYPDAFLGYIAMTLGNMAVLMMQNKRRIAEAKQAAQESLNLFKKMAQKAPQRWNPYVDMAQEILDEINGLL